MRTRTRWESDEAFTTAQELGVDVSVENFDLEEFRLGMCVELVHGSRHPETDITHDDPLVTGKIALARLLEIHDYYTRLVQMEADAEV